MPQDGGLIPHWRVERNVELVPRLLGWDREPPPEARTREMLELVGLDPAAHAGRYPAELSGGQRQRVAFARALAADPPLILLDEPFGALDALTRLELHRQFLELKKALGKTTVLVTHDLAEAFRLADRIGVMRAGRLLQLGAPAELAATAGGPVRGGFAGDAACVRPSPPNPPLPVALPPTGREGALSTAPPPLPEAGGGWERRAGVVGLFSSSSSPLFPFAPPTASSSARRTSRRAACSPRCSPSSSKPARTSRSSAGSASPARRSASRR